MKKLIKYSSFILAAGFLVSCSESRNKASQKLNELNEQVEQFNTSVDDGLKRIESIDSVVRLGAEQIKEYDSLVKKSSSRIDSIAKSKAKAWEELTNW